VEGNEGDMHSSENSRVADGEWITRQRWEKKRVEQMDRAEGPNEIIGERTSKGVELYR